MNEDEKERSHGIEEPLREVLAQAIMLGMRLAQRPRHGEIVETVHEPIRISLEALYVSTRKLLEHVSEHGIHVDRLLPLWREIAPQTREGVPNEL